MLRVVELQTGNTIYATQLRSMVVSASFFADGRRLYVETFPLTEAEGGRATVFQQAVIDLETRRLDQQLRALGTGYIALNGPSLLGHEFSLQTSQTTSLVLAALPDYKEIARVPFAVGQEPERYGRPAVTGRGMIYGHDTVPVISADRNAVVYATGHSIVCRRTSNLDVLWTHLIEPDYLGAWALDLTPDGGRVAAAIVGGSAAADQDKFYIGVYDGKDGSSIARLPLNGREGVAISPDGRLLAVSQQAALADGGIEPTVNIYDVASGSQVGKTTHSAVSVSGFGNSGKAKIDSHFTPDGKYLITSGLSDTTVWAIRR